MRTLKFRAYDSATGKVSEPFDVKESWGDYLIDFEDYSTDGALDSIIWEQFTGLLDRNGKEIYEGDIVRYHSAILLGYAICVVTFYNCRWTLFQHDAPVWAISEGDSENIEVIGNIHENPELLGGEE